MTSLQNEAFRVDKIGVRGNSSVLSSTKPSYETVPSRSKESCWTCRRRRVQCDKLLPSCQKCHRWGRECLGYKKPLVWAKGVASRGKMMGKTFEAIEAQRLKHSPKTDIIRASCPSSEVVLNRSRNPVLINEFEGIRFLVDPILKDFHPLTRFYLNYYTQKLCSETVIHDIPGQNPYRDLMSKVQSSPLLLKCILATATRHAANNDISPSSFPKDCSSQSSRSNLNISIPSQYHALWYKQNALRQLRLDLQASSDPNDDLVIASIALIIWTELLESGKNTWRIHLEGWKELTEVREGHEGNKRNESRSLPSGVRPSLNLSPNSYLFYTCIICDIMGTTLAQPYKVTKPMLPSTAILNCLKRSEGLSFLGCPADLLYIIILINWQCWAKHQSGVVEPESLQPAKEIGSLAPSDHEAIPPTLLQIESNSIMAKIQAFDPIEWAHQISLITSPSDVVQRTNLASAYKLAVLIYAARILNLNLPDLPTIPEMASQVVSYLSCIPTQDPFFKCIMWPAFIAGAETDSQPQRIIVKSMLRDFWVELRCENVANAGKVLDEIWKSGTGALGTEGKRTVWTDHLAREGVDWLFI